MPELPEVETTLRGIEPYVLQQTIEKIVIRQPQLRWPIPADMAKRFQGQTITQMNRRAKYLLFHTAVGSFIIHLGMSGSLRLVNSDRPVGAHDHFDIAFGQQKILRYTDPRRFGALLWTADDPYEHALLNQLGPEPLEPGFSGQHLFDRAKGRRVPVKTFIMDAKVVVGVGNIYAAEALFLAGISPLCAIGQLSLSQWNQITAAIKSVLRRAIKDGGTSLKDYVNSAGKPGYFATKLNVYGRGGLPCVQCHRSLTSLCLNQRTTVYCEHCQVG